MATDSGNHSDGLCFPRLTQPKPFEIHPSPSRRGLVVSLTMNRVEPLDESVGTNSTALLEDVSQDSPEVKDVPTDYVNLEDNPSIEEDQNNRVDTLEKRSESVMEDKEIVLNETQDKYIQIHVCSFLRTV